MSPLAVIPYIGSKEDGFKQQKIIKIISFVIGVLVVIITLWYILLPDSLQNSAL
jgi:K+ transporter